MARKLTQMKYGSGLAALAGPHPRSALCKALAVYLNVLCEHRPCPRLPPGHGEGMMEIRWKKVHMEKK